jgi:hypothetical protein
MGRIQSPCLLKLAVIIVTTEIEEFNLYLPAFWKLNIKRIFLGKGKNSSSIPVILLLLLHNVRSRHPIL